MTAGLILVGMADTPFLTELHASTIVMGMVFEQSVTADRLLALPVLMRIVLENAKWVAEDGII